MLILSNKNWPILLPKRVAGIISNKVFIYSMNEKPINENITDWEIELGILSFKEIKKFLENNFFKQPPPYELNLRCVLWNTGFVECECCGIKHAVE